MNIIMIATTKRIRMKPPTVELVTNPRIHKIISVVAIVVNISLMVRVISSYFFDMVARMLHVFADTLDCSAAWNRK